MENNLDNLIIYGKITATSNKQDEAFPAKKPAKSAYITVKDTESKKILEDNGFQLYTTKDKQEYFIIKVAQKLEIYDNTSDQPIAIKNGGIVDDDGTTAVNFSTKDEVDLNIIICPNDANKKKPFYRLKSILVEDISQIVDAVSQNPFKK